MLNLGNGMIKDLLLGEKKVTVAYLETVQVWPNIVSVEKGTDYTEWTYTDPKRTRTATPWERDVYSNGTKSPIRYGSATTETQTATTSTETDGYWNGSCSGYDYVDYVKQRTVYKYTDNTRYSAYSNGTSRSRKVEGSCGWVRSWHTENQWRETGRYCNSAGTTGAYDCDGTYSVDYYQEEQREILAYPDGTAVTPIQERTVYRVGKQHSRIQVDGQCGYTKTITIRVSLEGRDTQFQYVGYDIRAEIDTPCPFSAIEVRWENQHEGIGSTLIIPRGELYSDWVYAGKKEGAWELINCNFTAASVDKNYKLMW